MVCRIDVAQDADTCTVHVAGRLSAPTVGDLLRVCGDAQGTLRIDLTDLLSVDSAGIVALRGLIERGAAVGGVAEYLREELAPRTDDAVSAFDRSRLRPDSER